MPANSRITALCLAATILTGALLLLAAPAAAQTFGMTEGCFQITSGITSPSPGRYSFINAFGPGKFFFNVKPAGQGATFNFDIDTTTTPGLITGGDSRNDVTLLATDGSKIFGRLDGTSTGPDADGVVTFEGTMQIFGGTRAYEEAKGSARLKGTLYTRDAVINGAAVKANTAEICFSGHLRTPFLFGAGDQSAVVFGLLLTGWAALLFYRRKRGAQA